MKGDSMTGEKFPVIRPRRKRRVRASRPSLPSPASLRLGTVDAAVARDLIGQIARLASAPRHASVYVASFESRFARIEAITHDLSEIIDRAEVRA